MISLDIFGEEGKWDKKFINLVIIHKYLQSYAVSIIAVVSLQLFTLLSCLHCEHRSAVASDTAHRVYFHLQVFTSAASSPWLSAMISSTTQHYSELTQVPPLEYFQFVFSFSFLAVPPSPCAPPGTCLHTPSAHPLSPCGCTALPCCTPPTLPWGRRGLGC